MSSSLKLLNQPFSIAWRKALVSLPRAVPLQVLRYTSPEGPQPFIFGLPSRGKHLIPCYIFVPDDLDPQTAADLPVIIDFHGGGFVLGSCLEQAPFCAKLARELRAVVLTVDYRMGPIDKFPAAIEDAEDLVAAIIDPECPSYIALRVAISDKAKETSPKITGSVVAPKRRRYRRSASKSSLKKSSASLKTKSSTISASTTGTTADLPALAIGLDITRIAVSGFSSGGNLALNLALSIPATQLHLKEAWPTPIPANHPRPIPFLLFYPSFDARQLPSERARPTAMGDSGLRMLKQLDDLLMPTYLPREKAEHPRASPGLASLDGLHDKARMMLVLPELDTLSEQSEAWVTKMEEAGLVRGEAGKTGARAEGVLQVKRFKGMKHGWTQMPGSWLGEEEKRTTKAVFEDTVNFIRENWAQQADQMLEVP